MQQKLKRYYEDGKLKSIRVCENDKVINSKHYPSYMYCCQKEFIHDNFKFFLTTIHIGRVMFENVNNCIGN